jgi:hypothetical protein
VAFAIFTGSGNDRVLVDFADTQPRTVLASDLAIFTGSGDDTVTVQYGGSAGLYINTGAGNDSIKTLQLSAGSLFVDGGGGNDNADLLSRTVVNSDANLWNIENVLSIAEVSGNMTTLNFRPANIRQVGAVSKNLSVYGVGGSLRVDGDVGGNLTYSNSPWSSSGASLVLNANVAGTLNMVGTRGADRLIIGELRVASANQIVVNLGEGDDFYELRLVSSERPIVSAIVDGGSGTDTYVEIRPTWQQLIGFESLGGNEESVAS